MTELQAAVRQRGISRICHFTPSRNLQHIGAGKVGVLSTAALEANERECLNATDVERFDGRKTHICCSIEFPNGWYFDRARSQDKIFPDWVVLLVDPKYLWNGTTLFCPRNAAAANGRLIKSGLEGFQSLFVDEIVGTGGRTFRRSARHIAQCPTDQQAEVLVEDRIALADIQGVAVRNEDQARTERARLRTNGVDPDLFRFVIAPHLFDKHVLNAVISSGKRPAEKIFVPGNQPT